MSEKPNKTLTGAGASVPNKMRLYATWVDRTPSNCIPRLCTLTLTRLQILKPLGSEVASISIAVKMQSSKRTLRSNELMLSSNGSLDTPLDVTFCLQYPHFLKREGNKLHVLLQRRKKYKNRTMLGFKTLAGGVIRMDQVLQKPMDLELDLSVEGGGKDNSKALGPYARLYIVQVSSTPVDQQEHKTDREHDFSDDDDELSSGEEEAGDLSDSEPIRTKLPHRRHNFKQRFVSLLRRFRVPEAEGGRGADLDNPSDIQALFQELESLSCDEDSGAEQDTMSISSTPKPSLRPFFSSSKSLLETSSVPHIDTEKIVDEKATSGSDGNADMGGTDQEGQGDPLTGSPPRDQNVTSKKQTADHEFANILQEISEKKSKIFRTSASLAKKKNSLSVSSDVPVQELTVRKGFLEQIARYLPLDENVLPECIVIMTGPENITSSISSKLVLLQSTLKVFQATSAIEVKTLLAALFSKIHKYCAKPNTPIKIVLMGGDTLIGWFVRPFVEIMSSKPSEWLSYIRMFIIPLGNCGIGRHLASLDVIYQSLFPQEAELKIDDIAQKAVRYISVPLSAPLAQLPIGEAMLTCYDETSQLFIPFVNEVRVGPSENTLSASVDLDDICSSPPAPSLTPPSSPNVHMRESPWEPVELQIDFWQTAKYIETIVKTEKEKDKSKQDNKTSIKGAFRGLQATPSSSSALCLNLHMTNKEKKQKIMRLGKKKEKEKDSEPRCQSIEGVSRLICSAKASHNTPMRVYIDGVEFNGVKFFQLSSTWQTHVKNLSISLIGVPLACSEMN